MIAKLALFTIYDNEGLWYIDRTNNAHATFGNVDGGSLGMMFFSLSCQQMLELAIYRNTYCGWKKSCTS